MEKYIARVGTHNYQPWNNYSRTSLEYSAKELSLPETFIEQLSDEELFNVIIKVSCAQDAKVSLKEEK